MGFKVAIFSLNQWALDFDGNTRRIKASIDKAHEAKAAYRSGPELELCGFSLEDAFFEQDTVYHSWKCMLDIIEHSTTINMIIDVGMPIYWSGALYNCRVITYMGKILCVRAKTSLAREGLYREGRHFTAWNSNAGLSKYPLPSFVAEKLQQQTVPFGAGFILELEGNRGSVDTFKIGWEICQELWDPSNASASLCEDLGCHLILNSSGSYWQLRKLNTILDIIRDVSLREATCYAFSNLVGCDGQRIVFYGRSCFFDRGKLVAMASTDSNIFDEVQMVTYNVNQRAIEEHRSQFGFRKRPTDIVYRRWTLSNTEQSGDLEKSHRILYLSAQLPECDNSSPVCDIASQVLRFEQEIHHYIPLWLWDYLRRSRMVGFMIPLSGGLDSSSVALLVYAMCNHIHSNIDNSQVQDYFSSVHKIPHADIATRLHSPEAICAQILKCCYLSTKFSSQETLNRALVLSVSIGAKFQVLSLQEIYSSFRTTLAESPSFETTLLDQNLQARLRMAATYYISGGDRILLATGNVDEAIMGYLTKYDCSSADINPIGGLCKDDLKSYLRYCCTAIFNSKVQLVKVLEEIIAAPPSAELTGAEQRDEDEIGLTYAEISILGKVRRGEFGSCGPKGAFETIWMNRQKEPYCTKIRCLANDNAGFEPERSTGTIARELADLVKRFYQRYARNRHKLTVLTPALHSENYSPDDNRFDHRHFLYAPWTEQFKAIDEIVSAIDSSSTPPSLI